MTWEELETYNNGEIWNKLNLKIEDDYYNGNDIICDIGIAFEQYHLIVVVNFFLELLHADF